MKQEHRAADHSPRHDAGEDALRQVDVGGVVVTFREVYARHHAAAYAEHQANACHDEEERGYDIDCREGVAAHAVAYEGAVGDVEHHH